MTEWSQWFRAAGIYLAVAAMAHLVWETIQLPLYTIWTTDPWQRQVFAVLHCTAGDVMVAAFTLLAALFLFGTKLWPSDHASAVAVYLAMLLFGVAYTIYSEWLNTTVPANWTYKNAMPIVPLLNIGLSPLLQWLVVPTFAMWVVIGRQTRVVVDVEADGR